MRIAYYEYNYIHHEPYLDSSWKSKCKSASQEDKRVPTVWNARRSVAWTRRTAPVVAVEFAGWCSVKP